MSKSKPYEEQKTENQMASEASMMYETARSMDDFVASIPVDLMQQLIDISIRDCKAGKGIRHRDLSGELADRKRSQLPGGL